MTDEAKRAHADYMKDWRRRNPEKQKEYDARHWEKVAAERKAAEDNEEEVLKNNHGN